MAAEALPRPRPGHEACTGCALCLLPCPVWWETRDPLLTVMGRAKALQGGASAEALSASLEACVLCGACEPICPERIDTIGMTLSLRGQLAARGAWPLADRAREARPERGPGGPGVAGSAHTLLLAGRDLAARPEAVQAMLRHLGRDAAVAEDDGRDLALDLEVGLPLQPSREQRWLSALAPAHRLVVAEGLLHRFLRERLPKTRVVGVAEALLEVRTVRAALRPSDLLIFEARGYHADFERLVRVYDRVRRDTGCLTNLDLHRLAISTGATSAQARLGAGRVDADSLARFVAEGRRPARVVVESESDREPFARTLGVPVVHLAEVA
jgi:NAD-dependent dihydropyrimidine dehydrogenase PreA subunit